MAMIEEFLTYGYQYISDIANLIVPKDKTVIEVLDAIDKSEIGMVFVVNSDMHLIGVVVDRDIRKFILRGGKTSEIISKAMNSNPQVLREGFAKEDFLNAIQKNSRRRNFPVINKVNILIGCVSSVVIKSKQTFNNTIVVMVGGQGKRLRPLTDHVPKPMLKISEKPLLEIIVNQLKRQGFYKIIFAINYLADYIKDYFKDGKEFGVNIEYFIENERLGTAGALGLIQKEIKEPFFVMNGDLLTKVDFRNILKFHLQENNFATIGVTEYDISIPFGVFHIEDQKVRSIVEKPVYKYQINAGICLFNPEALNFVNKKQHLDMTDLLNIILKKDLIVSTYPIVEYWLDIGHEEEYKKAHIDYLKHFK